MFRNWGCADMQKCGLENNEAFTGDLFEVSREGNLVKKICHRCTDSSYNWREVFEFK